MLCRMEAWRIEFSNEKVSKSGLEGSLFGVLEGLGTPLETFWRHCVLLGGLWGVLGSILGALGTHVGCIW